MNKLFNFGKMFVFFAIIIPLMSLVSVFIYYQYQGTKEKVFNIIQSNIIDEHITLLENYADNIKQTMGKNFKKDIIKDKKIYQNAISELRLIQSAEIRYIYILYKDKDDKLRYLMDATTDTKERAYYHQLFNPLTDIWDEAYKQKTVQIATQNHIDSLWITIAYPIVIDGDVIAIIGADFDYHMYQELLKTLQPLENLYLYISIFMLIMLSIAYVLIYLYYTNRKKRFIDPLTGMYNRQYLHEYLKTSSLKEYAIMMIDIDHFKHINDNYGHDVGDKVLVSLSNELKSQLRENDILVRYGGEEFLILVHKKEDANFYLIAERIRESIMQHKIQGIQQNITVTISIGINPYPFYAKNFDEAVKITDEQLYSAKSSGRNCIKISNEKNTSQTSKRISDVISAIQDDRITCMFQPIVSMKTSKIEKYEMLLRMIDTKGNIVPPMEFLPSIRHTSIYVSITKIILEIAVKTLEENDFDLSINLDLQDLTNNDIVKLLEENFKEKKELAARLYIEILEHEEITDFEFIKEKIDALKNLGFKIVIDDFGSGFANFKYLLYLNIDVIKLDGSLIQGIHNNKNAYHIVESIARFANKMGIRTVAEQIETQEELNCIKELQVDFAQGYYLGRPSFEIIETL